MAKAKGDSAPSEVMQRHLTSAEFESAVIAQDDDEDYSESGYVACVFPDGVAAIGHYSHCSCYGTFDALCGGGVGDTYSDGMAHFNWSGTVDELVSMAIRVADPVFPESNADPKDYDFDHLVRMYEQVRAWHESKGGAA